MTLPTPHTCRRSSTPSAPPGTHMLFGMLYGLYPSGGTIVALQCVLSILVPLLVGAIGWELYGKRAALIGLAMSSLYFRPSAMRASFSPRTRSCSACCSPCGLRAGA